MILFSLNNIIDDILLIIRNSNISESEDLSRALIESWVHEYRSVLIKLNIDKGYDVDSCFCLVLDNVEILKEVINSLSGINISDTEPISLFKYRTKNTIPDPINLHYGDGIILVTDLYDLTIQPMSKMRRSFQLYRRYTSNEYTYYLDSNYLYVQGPDALKYIRITGIFEDPILAGLDADDVYPMPASMIPTLKKMIFDNELKISLSLPSDDKDDASMSSVKPKDK